MLCSRFFVLGVLFVSFHPSRFRSHSCSTGASLRFRFRFSSGLSACFPVSFDPFSPLLTTQPSALSFPFFPFSPGSGSFGACLSAFRSACFHASLSALVLSFLHFLSTFSCFASQWLRSVVILPISLPDFPLGFRFRFYLLGLSVLNFSVRLRPRIYYHFDSQMSTPILYIIQLLCCVLRPTSSIF